eukprot:1148672-Pelagomonas_calceolata.AAC.1
MNAPCLLGCSPQCCRKEADLKAIGRPSQVIVREPLKVKVKRDALFHPLPFFTGNSNGTPLILIISMVKNCCFESGYDSFEILLHLKNINVALQLKL